MILFSIQLILLILINLNATNCLHLKGTFNTNDFYKFLTRFGIQSTDTHDASSTLGYIYGNISIVNTVNLNLTQNQLPPNLQIMLTVMDYNYFIDYYNNRRIMPRSVACPMMFEKIDKTAYFYGCNEKGKQDFIRRVPCPENKLCIDEDNQKNVIEGHQFTYKIQDSNQARFWYISLVACVRDQCEWKYLNDLNNHKSEYTTGSPSINNLPNPSYTVAYDIWLVNGSPTKAYKNHFEHQFTYENHDIFEIYLSSFMIYLFILPFIIYRLRKHFHRLYLQLLVYISIELTSRLLSLIHNFVFSFNGRGVYFLQFISDFLEAIASSILILILISVAKGWTIRSKVLKTSTKSLVLGFVLQFILVVSHMISLATVDPVFNTNSYETVAGYVELGVRFVFMVWFLIELKETANHLESAALSKRRDF